MNFWELKQDNISIIDKKLEKNFSYKELQEIVNKLIDIFPKNKSKQLGFIMCNNSILTLSAYLAGLQSNNAICLLNQNLNQELLNQLLEIYKPEWIFSLNNNFDEKKYEFENKIHDDLALLLSTSGTTGSPKMVRLSKENIKSNAKSISNYLNITEKERAITSLPFNYSYGLSVINSHLYSGSTILFTEQSIVERDFWKFFKDYNASSIASVPSIYQMLYRMNIDKLELSSLKTLTQAGGHLNKNLSSHFCNLSKKNNWNFFVMYGQTEATARISYVPSEKLENKIGSIGIAIPDGKLSIDAKTNELIYQGKNVMMGYSYNRNDLSKGDECMGILKTGDIATFDEDGYFTITGRIKRFVKLWGLRINLDELEKQLSSNFLTPIVCLGNDDKIFIIIKENKFLDDISSILKNKYKIHSKYFQIKIIDSIPYTDSGKIDYIKIKNILNIND